MVPKTKTQEADRIRELERAVLDMREQRDAARKEASIAEDRADEAEEDVKKWQEFAEGAEKAMTEAREHCETCRNEPERGVGRCARCRTFLELLDGAP